MKIYIQKLKSTEIFFFIAYMIYMSESILLMSFYGKYLPNQKYALILCVGLLVFNELLSADKINIKTMFGLIVCLLLFVITFSTSGYSIAGMFIFIYCARNISFEKISKWTVHITAIMVLFIVMSSFLGIIQDYVDLGERVRHYLGFCYALFPSTLIFNITLLVIYRKNTNIKWKDIIVLFFINCFFFYFTNSRLSFGLSIFALLIGMIYKYKYNYLNKPHIFYKILIFSFIICSVISFVLTILYSAGVGWMRELNSFLGNRLILGQISLLQYGVNLLGKKIPWVGNGLDYNGKRATGTYLWVDNLYVKILQRFGIVFFIVFLLFITFALYKCYKTRKYYLLIFMMIIALHCTIDDGQLELYNNTFWFIIGTVLFGRKINGQRNELL